MIDTYRGYVNTWECDDVGHMNVQFYMVKLDQAFGAMSVALGLGPRASADRGLKLQPLEDHIHFQAELRASDTVTIQSSVETVEQDGLRIYSEVRNAVTDTIAATARTSLHAAIPDGHTPAMLPEDVAARAETLKRALPDHARPRSVGHGDAPLPALTIEEGQARDLIATHFGVVHPRDCNADQIMLRQGPMARYSDGGGHLWAGIGMDRQSLNAKGLGVALIEYHQRYLIPIRAGTVIRTLSGLTAIGRKTVTFAHFMFDAETGTALARAEATGLLLDLKARKSADLTAEDRDRLMTIRARHALRV